MGKQVPKMSARVVNAIKNLREVHGSTSREIMSYIMSQYSAPELTIQRQMQAALKRGLDYGILKRQNGHYFLNMEADIPQIMTADLPSMERARKRRRSRRRRGRRRRSSRRRRGKSRRRRRRSRRRSRRRGAKTRRVGCTNCRCNKRNRELQLLQDSPVESKTQEDENNRDKDNDAERRNRRSKSRNRSPTRSRSSVNSDQDAAMEDDRQTTRDQD
ncbi:PREDICTED: U1 small nuclear ribonucleoprotein 70 kDa [Dufourea novaeangliae]|uniref:U1 small nuclear ribonucleoprotein 70 kDa n=1 Tax=Dufourea novaeangliae TaxID=178035 RepID=UPI000767D8C8|nr:PREDICTED: U1 small nuclear ribonucleoprotein 70 kDa [Dufourea novaeangliae]